MHRNLEHKKGLCFRMRKSQWFEYIEQLWKKKWWTIDGYDFVVDEYDYDCNDNNTEQMILGSSWIEIETMCDGNDY